LARTTNAELQDMKALISVPLAVLIVFGALAIVATLAGMPVRPADAILAGAIGSAAGMLGLIPALRTRRGDPVAITQSALAGTVLHLLTQIGLAAAVMGAGMAARHGAFPLWLLCGYWTSLAVLIWQLRRIILGNSTPAGATE
jgi:hypothetical protein